MRPKGDSSVIKSKVAEEVTRLINSTDKTQFDIAAELGLTRTSNIITMFKQGRTKLPIRLVVPLAKACGEDPEKLMRIVLEEYAPDILEAMSVSFKAAVDESESQMLASIRHAKEVKEKKKREAAKRKATTPQEQRQAGLVRCEYDLSPEALKGLYDYVYKNLLN